MKKMSSIVSLLLAVLLLVGMLAGCTGDPAIPSGGSEKPSEAPSSESKATPNEDIYQLKGSVTIAYPEGEVAEIQPVLEAFRAQYPNIEVVEEPFPGSTGGAFNEYLTQKAAANAMPDLMWLDWNDFAPEVASGFVMPLDDYFFADPESEYVPSGMTDPYVYGGKLYALPCQMNAMGITICSKR